MIRDYMFDDAQPETGTARLARPGGVDPVEPLEDPVLFVPGIPTPWSVTEIWARPRTDFSPTPTVVPSGE
jgi:hypothetical protein